MDATTLIYRPAGFRPGRPGFIDSLASYTVSELWPYMAFQDNPGGAPILIQEGKVMEFLVFCGYGAEHSAIVASYLANTNRPYFCEPEAAERDTRRIVKLIDMSVVDDDLYDSSVGRGIALRPGVRLVGDDNDLISTEGRFQVYPGSADRWLGELADGTLFVGQAAFILMWLNDHDQDVPDDLEAALARG